MFEPLDREVISFRAQCDQPSSLDENVRKGVRRMPQFAIEAEVEAFIGIHSDLTDEQVKRLVVRNGSLPEREVVTGAGYRDREKRGTFLPNLLRSYLRKSKASKELIP